MAKKFKTFTEKESTGAGEIATAHDLVRRMEASFAEAQGRAGYRVGDAPATSEDELESLVGEAVRAARRKAGTQPRRKASRR